MSEDVSNVRADLSGRLRLCTSSGFGRNHLAQAISEFAQRYPLFEIQLELLDRPVDLVGEGFQLDIRIGSANDPSLIARRISSWDVRPSIEEGLLARILPDYEQGADVWAVYPARLSSSAKVRVFVEFLEQWLQSAGLSSV